MTEVQSYNILAQDYWCNKYSYVSYSYPDREHYIVSRFVDLQMRKLSVDVVRLAIDLAYIPPKHAEKLEFEPESLYDLEWIIKRTTTNITERKRKEQEVDISHGNPFGV